MPSLRDLLADSRVHVVDGAMGTMLYGRGVFLNVCYDELNLRQPELVREIHREYLRAGAEVLETNTFGANPLKLASYGLADDTDLLAPRLVARADVQQETVGAPGAEEPHTIVLRQQRGLRRARQATTAEAGLVGACDGELTIGQIVDALATLLETDAGELRAELLAAVRDFVAEGFLVSG